VVDIPAATLPTREPSAHNPDTKPEIARGSAIEYRSSHTPATAPANISATDNARLAHPGLLPPASEESAAIPVIVSVSTVVVRSRSPSFRTTALRTPIVAHGAR